MVTFFRLLFLRFLQVEQFQLHMKIQATAKQMVTLFEAQAHTHSLILKIFKVGCNISTLILAKCLFFCLNKDQL